MVVLFRLGLPRRQRQWQASSWRAYGLVCFVAGAGRLEIRSTSACLPAVTVLLLRLTHPYAIDRSICRRGLRPRWIARPPFPLAAIEGDADEPAPRS